MARVEQTARVQGVLDRPVQRAGRSGIQEWLSFSFKAPQVAPGLYPEHDVFIPHTKLSNTRRSMAGEEQITHLGVEYDAEDYLRED